MAWNFDISQSLANIQKRNALTPFTDFIQGAQAGQQAAIGQNQVAQIQRENQARPLAGAALNGDSQALAQLYSVDPSLGLQVAQNTGQDWKSRMDRSGAILFAAKDGSPEEKRAAVIAASKVMGSSPDPQELDPANFNNLLAQHQTYSQAMDWDYKNRQLGIEQRKADIEAATLANSINNQNRNYVVERAKADAMLSEASMPPIGYGSPPNGAAAAAAGPQPTPAVAGGAYPGADGITPGDKGGVFQPNTGAPGQVARAAVNPGQSQPIPQPTGRQAQVAPQQPSPPAKLNGFTPIVAGQPLQSPYGGTALFPNAMVANLSNGILAGQFPPDDMRLGKYAPQVKAALAASGYDWTKAREDWIGVQKNVATLNGPKMLGMRQAISQLEESIPLARDLAQQWQQQNLSGRFPPLNAASLTAAMNGAFGQQAQVIATRLSAQINHMSPELGMIYKGGTTATDAAMEKADSQLKANWSYPQLMGALDLIETNMGYRKNSLLQGALGAGGQPVSTPGLATAKPSAGKPPVTINGYTIQEN